MTVVRRAVLPLRATLVASFAMLVLLQVFSMPGQFRHMAEENPEDAELRWPLTIVAILVIGCVQVVIVCTWRLLTMVARDRIFTAASLRWVDAIIAAIGVGWLLLAGILLGLAGYWDDPAGPLLIILLLLAGGALGLLVVVMRELLRQATDLRSDLDSVI
ncbi:DUF2975 domain-containing protein [Nocardioides sp. zg-536]|uniref:DUF2975 domain-containing protein n=1 Tax=Nocardioides faecalis TaxID=2803858 RepID=A0A938Y718_9ACTN|nr:DUF2975 domain-containing protein [Nocardioides faecalis]MBM9460379.1 DUF2975 domain-containing protein [Nocardioides faecalis]MBS4751304.1 DUF2975 domain-containing protein [Nocardioides faecalis]QVI59794.1 DUF2975 domain-containing protein [Nocardioides faecalis]